MNKFSLQIFLWEADFLVRDCLPVTGPIADRRVTPRASKYLLMRSVSRCVGK